MTKWERTAKWRTAAQVSWIRCTHTHTAMGLRHLYEDGCGMETVEKIFFYVNCKRDLN